VSSTSTGGERKLWFFSRSFLIRSVQHYHEEVKGFITDNKTRRERERELLGLLGGGLCYIRSCVHI